jgi:hypothetical protein
MEAQIKRKWVKALRSGRYKQTQGALMSGDANCCLGVLCRVVRAKVSDGLFRWEGDEDWALLPEKLRKEVGLTRRDQHKLSVMNDNGKSFIEIANYIQRCL